MDINDKDVISVMRQQLAAAMQDSCMNAAIVLAQQRRIEELEKLLRESKS